MSICYITKRNGGQEAHIMILVSEKTTTNKPSKLKRNNWKMLKRKGELSSLVELANKHFHFDHPNLFCFQISGNYSAHKICHSEHRMLVLSATYIYEWKEYKYWRAVNKPSWKLNANCLQRVTSKIHFNFHNSWIISISQLMNLDKYSRCV